jgi:putative sigma-54 modulation protein
MTPEILIRSSFDYSDTLSRHIERRVTAALRSQVAQVEGIVLKLLDVNGPRGGANDKVVRITVSLKPWGRLVASAASSDIYLSVDSAANRLKTAVHRHCSRLKARHVQAAGEGRRRDAD